MENRLQNLVGAPKLIPRRALATPMAAACSCTGTAFAASDCFGETAYGPLMDACLPREFHGSGWPGPARSHVARESRVQRNETARFGGCAESRCGFRRRFPRGYGWEMSRCEVERPNDDDAAVIAAISSGNVRRQTAGIGRSNSV